MSINQQIIDWDAALDDFERQLNLSPYKSPGLESELELYLTMDREEITRLTKDGRGEIAYRLQQFALHILRTQNKNIARVNRVRKMLGVYLADKLAKLNNSIPEALRYAPYEEKTNYIIGSDTYAYQLSNVLQQLQARIDRLDGMAKSIEQLSMLMKSLSYSKEQNG